MTRAVICVFSVVGSNFVCLSFNFRPGWPADPYRVIDKAVTRSAGRAAVEERMLAAAPALLFTLAVTRGSVII